MYIMYVSILCVYIAKYYSMCVDIEFMLWEYLVVSIYVDVKIFDPHM